MSDVLAGYTPGSSNAGDFLRLVESGGSTRVEVNADGAGADFVQLATLQGATGLILEDLVSQGNLVLA